MNWIIRGVDGGLHVAVPQSRSSFFEVLLIRDEGGYRSKHQIDMLSDELLASPYYMIKSNDIIYIEPLKSKKWGMDTFPYELILSVASLTIVTLTFMVTYLN